MVVILIVGNLLDTNIFVQTISLWEVSFLGFSFFLISLILFHTVWIIALVRSPCGGNMMYETRHHRRHISHFGELLLLHPKKK